MDLVNNYLCNCAGARRITVSRYFQMKMDGDQWIFQLTQEIMLPQAGAPHHCGAFAAME